MLPCTMSLMNIKSILTIFLVAVGAATVAKFVGSEVGRADAEKDLSTQHGVSSSKTEPDVYPNGWIREPTQLGRAERGQRVQKAITCVERRGADLSPLNAGVCDQARIRVQWFDGRVVMEGGDIGP